MKILNDAKSQRNLNKLNILDEHEKNSLNEIKKYKMNIIEWRSILINCLRVDYPQSKMMFNPFDVDMKNF